MLIEVNVENIQLYETGMLREVNVERCGVVTVNVYYLQHAFLWLATGGGLLLGLYSRTF